MGSLSCDLRLVEQIADSEQVASLAQMVRYCVERGLPGAGSLEEAASDLWTEVSRDGLAAIESTSYSACGLAMPREQEVFACLNRLRRL